MVNWRKLIEAVLQPEFPDSDLLLQFTACHVPKDLAINPTTRGQFEKLSHACGLGSDNAMGGGVERHPDPLGVWGEGRGLQWLLATDGAVSAAAAVR